jgi:hypothetical protein
LARVVGLEREQVSKRQALLRLELVLLSFERDVAAVGLGKEIKKVAGGKFWGIERDNRANIGSSIDDIINNGAACGGGRDNGENQGLSRSKPEAQ